MKKLILPLLVLSLLAMLPSLALRDLSKKYELVLNVASKKLIVYGNGQPEKEYPVGVGKSLTPTPL